MGTAKSISALIVISCFIITQASAGNFVLHIFGNANMDDRIDENDLEFIRMVIQGEKSATELCDADHNGVVDASDITQVERIINGTATEITVIDSDGNVVTLPQPLERLVIYNHQCAEVLQLMGVDDRVVGVRDTFAEQRNRFPRLSQVTSIGSGGEPNIEAILKVKPQVVLAYTFYPVEDALDAKLPPDVKVLRLDCECSGIGPDAMREKITMMGYIFGTQDRAEKYLKWHDAIVSQVEERVKTIPEDKRVRVYLESTPEGSNPQTSRTAIGSGHAANKLIEMAGGVNIAVGHLPKYLDTPTEYGEIETEWVISQNPDVIVGRAMGKGIRPYENVNSSLLQSYDREIRNLPGFDRVKAVQDGRVYIITNDYAVTPNYPSALLALAKWFYPELFQDVDPVAAHQEYVNMMGLDFDVRTRGAFTFHAGNSS
ncbi:periplasmic binding protein [Methanothrix thermoacetophila PT]|uniref:Periplasmic binding protein n=2 Tax=Methanothrix TaxID=2222 RepID=A0B7T4_METTP|nr:periplasmic binding protein [Methanothrix thermoacetophila PT]